MLCGSWLPWLVSLLVPERQDEVVYYDTYESIDAMQDTEHMAASVHLQKEDLLKLQQKGRQLEARRGRISAKKAYLRNKKVTYLIFIDLQKYFYWVQVSCFTLGSHEILPSYRGTQCGKGKGSLWFKVPVSIPQRPPYISHETSVNLRDNLTEL